MSMQIRLDAKYKTPELRRAFYDRLVPKLAGDCRGRGGRAHDERAAVRWRPSWLRDRRTSGTQGRRRTAAGDVRHRQSRRSSRPLECRSAAGAASPRPTAWPAPRTSSSTSCWRRSFSPARIRSAGASGSCPERRPRQASRRRSGGRSSASAPSIRHVESSGSRADAPSCICRTGRIRQLGASLMVRSHLEPGAVMSEVRRAVQAIDQDQPVFTMQTMESDARAAAVAVPRVREPLRDLRGDRAHAVRGRALRGDGVFGHAADAGDRCPHGAWRRRKSGVVADSPPRPDPGGASA